MRLSEKSVELNFCSEASQRFAGRTRTYWCGLTQAQEAKEGIDVAGRLNGKLYIFQFKASNQFSRGLRQFHAPHHQFTKLRTLAAQTSGVYYVFPDIGTSEELVLAPDLLSRTWLCDASQPALATLSAPTRRSGEHLVSLDSKEGIATWYSQPVRTEIIRADRFFGRVVPRNAATEVSAQGRDGAPSDKDRSELLHAVLGVSGRKMLGMVIA